jgi:hypothetical protein
MQNSKVLHLTMQFKQSDIIASMMYSTSTIATTLTTTPLG